mgnify:CR=1 FL=1
MILENGLVDPEEGLEQMNRELEANFIEPFFLIKIKAARGLIFCSANFSKL